MILTIYKSLIITNLALSLLHEILWLRLQYRLRDGM